MTITLYLHTASFCFAQSIAPSVVSSAGEHYIGTDFSLSWTLGEPAIETFKNGNTNLTQGFHQPSYEITGIEENKELGYEVSVYPNPATDFITIEIKNVPVSAGNAEIKIELIDISGKVLLVEDLKRIQEKYSLNMQNYSAGSYLLKISTADAGLIQSFKISKLK